MGIAWITSLLAILILTVPALAGVSWCRAVPIVLFDGVENQIIVLTITIGGDAVVMESGAVTYSGGTTFVVEMTNNGTSLTTQFPAS